MTQFVIDIPNIANAIAPIVVIGISGVVGYDICDRFINGMRNEKTRPERIIAASVFAAVLGAGTFVDVQIGNKIGLAQSFYNTVILNTSVSAAMGFSLRYILGLLGK